MNDSFGNYTVQFSCSVLPTEQEISNQVNKSNRPEDTSLLNKKSSSEYKFDWRSTEASLRAVEQNLAIEAQRTTSEYQISLQDKRIGLQP